VDAGAGGRHRFEVKVKAGRVPAGGFRVEVYADPGEVHVLERDGGDKQGVFTYSGSAPATRPAADYTPRVVPWHQGAQIPLECAHILWYS
jgi:starch phosphorylase